jgi:predicted aconitase with swiveling domain
MTEGVHVLVDGEGSGPALVLVRPLSFWGGVDATTGRIIDQRHPQVGASVSGMVLVMEAGRGSSSASSVLIEAVRLMTAPAAIVMLEPDEIVALGAVVAGALYGTTLPVVVVDHELFGSLRSGEQILVRGNTITRADDTT